MLDVHPPHAPTHTWRDFFLHIATIVVGLLIAVGLEQTVETIHHHHQRQELEKNLRDDGELNQGWANQDLDSVQTVMDWAQSQAAVVERAKPAGPLTLSPLAMPEITVPNFGVWLAAKANGQVSLLSTWQQNWLADLNRMDDQIFVSDTSFFSRLRTCLGELNQLLLDHAVPQESGALDVTSIAAAQRIRMAGQLLAIAEAARQFEGTLLRYAASNEFLLTNPEQLQGPGETLQKLYLIRHRMEARYPHTAYTFITH